jgi:hypothetical protein
MSLSLVARLEVLPEDSGNEMLAGRELPPAAVLAASQLLTARARQLRNAGFAARANLTLPLATLLDLAERPGFMPGIGVLDPALALDLAAAASRNPRSTWC